MRLRPMLVAMCDRATEAWLTSTVKANRLIRQQMAAPRVAVKAQMTLVLLEMKVRMAHLTERLLTALLNRLPNPPR